MKWFLLLFTVAFIMVNRSVGGDVDSSELIFNDSVVHSYELQYYIEDWDSAMEYNKEELDEVYMPARMIYRTPEGDSVVLDSIGVRYKGNSSYQEARNTPKKSFKFRFDEYDDYRDRHFFGLERLNFNNNVLDPSLMREKISYDIARKYMPASRACYATITIDGTMIGLYTQVEQVDELFLARHFKEPGGNLYKAGDDGAVLEYKGPNQSTYEPLYELKTNRNDNNWEGFINMLYKLNDTLSEKFTADMRTCLNLDDCIRHLAWTVVLSHFDSYTGSGRNYYMYDDPKSGQFFIIPWDLNLSFGQFSTGGNMITNSPIDIENLDERPLNRRILENDSLKRVYLSYLQDMIAGPASAEAVAAEADRLKEIIDSVVKVEPDTSKFYSYNDFLKNIESDVVIKEGMSETRILGIKSFSAQRNQSLTKQILAGVSYHPAATGKQRQALESDWNSTASAITVRFPAMDAGQTARFVLFDSRGRIAGRLTMQDSHDGTITWKTGAVVPGVYLIVMTGNDKSLTDRLVITR